MSGHTGQVLAARFTRNGRWAITGGADHRVKIWHAVSGTILAERLLNGPLIELLVSADGRVVYAQPRGDNVQVMALDRLEQSLFELVHQACSMLTPAQRRFAQTEIENDRLLRAIWLQSPGQDRDVCEAVDGIASFGARPPSTGESIERLMEQNSDLF